MKHRTQKKHQMRHASSYLFLLVMVVMTIVECSRVTKLLKSSGSSFTSPINRKLAQEYSINTAHTNYMEYFITNSANGFANMIVEEPSSTDGEAWVIGATDYVPTDLRNYEKPAMCAPSNAESLVFAANIDNNVTQLYLTPEIIVGIYNGTITKWTDSLIIQHNPNIIYSFLSMDDTIVPLFRTGVSGTSYLFSTWLCSISTSWQSVHGSSTYIPFDKFLRKQPMVIQSNSDMMKYVSQFVTPLIIIIRTNIHLPNRFSIHKTQLVIPL
jgi:ABC-type phosphate transport system substrate-binding protein